MHLTVHQFHDLQVDCIALRGCQVVVQVIEVPGSALPEVCVGAKSQVTVTNRPSSSVSGARLGRRVELDLMIVRNVSSAAYTVSEDAVGKSHAQAAGGLASFPEAGH